MIIAGTGHRPKYFPGKYDENDSWQVNLKLRLTSQLIQDNPKLVISGGALGFDMFLAEAALELDIPFDLYLPFKTMGVRWLHESKVRLSHLKENARRVTYTSWTYKGNYDFIKRDHAMVDDCDLLYACLNPEFTHGGTFATVEYATGKKSIKNFWK